MAGHRLLKVLDDVSIWINPIWILLGSALGLHGLWKTMKWPTLIIYLFLALMLTGLSFRSSLEDSQRQEQQALRDQHQEQREQKITSAQDSLNSELQAFSSQQTIIAHDLSRLANLEASANAMADVSARLTDLKSPGIQLINNSSVTARNISCELVLWNLELARQTPYQIPSDNSTFLKGHSDFLPTSIFLNRPFPSPNDGDRIFGYFSVDCANCASAHQFWVYFRYAHDGWTAPFSADHPIGLRYLFEHLESFKKEKNDQWLDQLASPRARLAIGSSEAPF